MEIVYVIPTGCPHEARFLVSNAWELGTVKQTIFEVLSPRQGLPKELGMKLNRNAGVSWTCSGCTVGLGADENDLKCRQRQCGLGGKELGTE
jgi:hypothetical protein